MDCQPGGHGGHLGHSMILDPSGGSMHQIGGEPDHKKKRDGSHVGSSSSDESVMEKRLKSEYANSIYKFIGFKLICG
ncbi:hypothetical protein WA026_013796 [Henosepilachna vigintioctopunctata]|uniref:Uncharacterized protein n=1 Tax=Henosepilachna vigintioctopunctata TaxID=420089 RepID=A0AAW1V130_9CUCU